MTWAGRALAVIAAMAFVSCLEPAQAPDPGDTDDSVPGPRPLSTFGAYAQIKVGDSLVFDGIRWFGAQMNQFSIDSIVRTIQVDSIFEKAGTGEISIYYTSRDIWRTYVSGYGTAGPGNPMIWRDSVFMGQYDTLVSNVDSFYTKNGDSAVFANHDFRNRADTSMYGITSYLFSETRFEPNMPLFRFWNTTARDSTISAGSESLSGWSASDSVIGELLNPSFRPWYFIIEKSKGLKYFEYRHPMRYTGGEYWIWKRRESR